MSAKYTFKKGLDTYNSYDNTTVEVTVESCIRGDIVLSFLQYLVACGYNVDDIKEILAENGIIES